MAVGMFDQEIPRLSNERLAWVLSLALLWPWAISRRAQVAQQPGLRPETSGPRDAESRPLELRKDVLTVRVDSSSWMQELAMQKRGLLKGLKREFGKDRITEIHFKLGEF